MTRKYMIYGADRTAGLRTRSFQPMGRRDAPRFRTAELDEKEASELIHEPGLTITPVMPTRLIKPLEAGPGGGTAWGVTAVGADQSSCDGRGVRVAVLDTGIAADHAAFAHANIRQKDFTGEGDGDTQGHGTHCAGTIFGRLDSERIGVAPGVTDVWIGKVLDEGGQGSSEMIFDALHWAMSEKVNIISLSLGFDFPGMVASYVEDGWDPALATSVALEAYRGNLRILDAIMAEARARRALGGAPLIIAASGNESQREKNSDFRIAASLPAAAEGVISVAALRPAGDGYDVCDFSNIHARLAAPGQDILSADPEGGLVAMSGTSMACPHVAGVAALWWQYFGQRANAERVAAQLVATCSRQGIEALDFADVGEGLVRAPTA